MKYRFITILHKMKLDEVKNKGFELFPGARISNGSKILDETLNSKLMKGTAGSHSADEFNNSVYFYIDGEFENFNSQKDADPFGTKYTFFFLRQIQDYLFNLWEIKDNNVYVRDGFLITYDKKIEDGATFKASLSAIFSCSTLTEENIIFSNNELEQAKKKYEYEKVGEISIELNDYKKVTDKHFYKKYAATRIDRAKYFILSARGSPIIPMKIVSYCTALECLFSISVTEITHRIAENIAIFIGGSGEEKVKTYKQIKKAYDVRSSIVHGSNIKDKYEDDIVKLSESLDCILRCVFNQNIDIFKNNNEELEKFFLNQILDT